MSEDKSEENAINLMIAILDNYPEIINEQIPQSENPVEKQNSK